MEEEIFVLAKTLGRVEAGELAALRTLCAAAGQEAAAWLKENLSPEDCGGLFPLAAAWLALAGLTAGREDGVERFAAGDVSVQTRAGGDAARREGLRRQARQVLAPFLRDSGFVFRGVPG